MNQRDQPQDYYPCFDWLRAIAATTVMLAHDGAIPWSEAGNFAVQVFFALSGWLIGGLLIRLEAKDLPRFFFNRATRIWIPYYFTAALLLTISVIREPITAKWIEFVAYKLTFVWNLFGTQQLDKFYEAMPQKGTLNHFWSVNAEEQFYLVAPLLLVVVAYRGGRAILTWALLAAAAMLLVPSYIGIVLGVLSAIVVKRFGSIHLTAVGRVVIAATLALSVWALFAQIDYQHVAPIAGLCIVLLLAVPGRKTAIGTVAGGMSYPLYLNHWIGGFTANFLMKRAPYWVMTTFSSTVSISLAIGLYWCIDRQVMQRRSGWFSVRRGYILTTWAYAMIAVGVAYGLYKLHQG